MSGYTGIIDATPGFVPGTFDAKDVRLGMFFNALPGLFASGDFAVSQRGAGANQSVDIAQGRALVLPAYTHGGAYMARRTSGTAYNTSADGGYTWAASDGANPRIDILGIEAADVDEGGSYTGWKFRVIDGTPNASAAHQLDVQYWPALPTDGSFVPIAAIRRAAGSTTIATADITNLNPIGGVGRFPARYTATAETTTSATYARLATPDALLVYVPNTAALLRLAASAHAKISVASGTQGVAMFLDGVQLRESETGAASPVVNESTTASLATFYNHVVFGGIGTAGWAFAAGSVADVSDGAAGVIVGSGSNVATPGNVIKGLSVGWHLLEQRWKTSANMLTVRERRMSAEVVG